MKVIIGENNEFLVEYKEGYEDTIKDNKNITIVDVDILPPYTKGLKSKLCFLNQDGTWFFDQNKYFALRTEKNNRILNNLKESMISQSKENLEKYISAHTVTSSCHGGVEAKYSITSEKQQHLASMIMTTQMTQQAGIPYQPSWNAAGQPCTYDWTLEELTQLAMEIEAVVRPLVSKQQEIEVAINACTTIEEVMAVDITFEDEEGADE